MDEHISKHEDQSAGLGAAAKEPREPGVVRSLKWDPSRGIYLVRDEAGRLRTLKTWPITPWEAFKLLIGIAQAQRQARGTKRLLKAQVATPKCVGGWRLRRFQGTRVIALELEYIEGSNAFEVLQAGVGAWPDTDVRAVGGAMGAIVADLSRARLFNRDLKMSNLIMEQAEGAELPGAGGAIYVIDAVGVRLQRNKIEELERMLERLAVEAVKKGIALPRAGVMSAVRAALSGQPKAVRRAIFQRLAARRPR